ncbi:MAG TPA: glycosyltransferase, partial [Ferruginibacter sp.]|nr:glycosyltransferase [Ferruginibacter sp.]HRE64173.1 glycosyltransferase [Ferruginibacter sp.]
KKYAITDRIIFQHFRQDVPDVLAAADIFVLPSLWEGLPIGLLEAMSMGKAIIASNVDGTKDIIVHNSNGELIELKNLAKELPEAIVKLAADDSLRMALGKQAIKTVQHNFNAAQMTLQIEQVYTQLLNKA